MNNYITNCSSLTWLSVANNPMLTDASIEEVTLRCTELVYLDISGARVSEKSLLEIASHLTEVGKFHDISKCLVGDSLHIKYISNYQVS